MAGTLLVRGAESSFFEEVDALWGIVGGRGGPCAIPGLRTNCWRAAVGAFAFDVLLRFVGIRLAAIFVPFLVFFVGRCSCPRRSTTTSPSRTRRMPVAPTRG